MAKDLQSTSTKLSNNQSQLTVKVPVEQIQNKVEGRIRNVARTAKIDGFRKGKVPMSHIRSQYGAGIQQEVINDVIRDTVFEAIKAEDVRAVGMPNIDDVKLEDEFLVYQASVEVFPEVEVQGLDELKVERHSATINDEDVDLMIENLRKQRQEFVEKEGAAAEGDDVVIDFEGSIDGEAFEGGKAEDFSLTLGSNQMIAGFEDGIMGMSAGEEKTINVTFPEDYQSEDLAGKDAEFKINVKTVKAAQLPEIDDEFLALFDVKEGGVEKLKEDVRKNMEREIKNAARNQLKQAAFDALIEKNEFDVPSAMVDQEIDRQRKTTIQRFAQQLGSDPSTMSEEFFPREMFEEQALNSARLGILVSRIIEENDMQVDQDRVTAYIKESAENYEEPEEVIEYFTTDKQQRANIESVVLENQVVDYIIEKAEVTDKEVSYQDLIASQQQSII